MANHHNNHDHGVVTKIQQALGHEKLPHVEIGVIGGTGVYGVDGLAEKTELRIDTPYGHTSSPIIVGKLEGVLVAFIARHDLGHRLSPTEVPYRANIYALKVLGVKYLLAFGACGSLQEHAAPQHIVLVDQFIDRTKNRVDTFFGQGVIAHTAMADPVCHKFRHVVKESLASLSNPPTVHDGGTYVCIEGPAFSTKAESNMYRQWNCTVIGMTGMPEVKLAREAEMAYAQISMVTDYDCWHPSHDSVTVEMVMKNLRANGDMAQRAVREVVKRVAANKFESAAHSALRFSILTSADHIPAERKKALAPIIGKYIPH